MAVCRKSSDATNVRWEPYAPDQGPDRDSPLGYLIASGIFVATYRAVPVGTYLGADARFLKGIGERFEPFGEPLRPFDQFVVRALGNLKLATVDDLVGKQQRGEQQLARFAQCAEARQRLATLGVDQGAGRAQRLFLAVAAGDLVGAAGDGEFDLRHQRPASRMMSSSSAKAPATFSRRPLSRSAGMV